MVTYAWKDAFKPNVDAQVAGEEIERLEQIYGLVKPQHVLEAARDQQSPLHGAFTWDDGKAAEMQRLSEARTLIRCLTIEIVRPKPEPPMVTRALVLVHSQDNRGFMPVERAMRLEDTRNEVLQRARQELANWAKRYKDLQELAELVQQVEAALVAA